MSEQAFDSLGLDSVENAEQTGEELLKLLSPEDVIKRILGVGSDALGEAARLFCLIVCVLLVCAVIRLLADTSAKGGIQSGVSFLCSAATVSAVVLSQSGAFRTVENFFERLGALMGSSIPVLGTVWAIGGNVSTASVGTATLYAMVALTETLCASAVMPVCYISGASAICAGLSDGGLLGGFCGAVKKIYTFFLGLVMTVFVFVLGAQTTIAASADTVALRSGKLLSSVAIPNIGGAVGDTLRTLGGSVGYIKSVTGIGGIVLVCTLALPVLASLLLSRLVFLVCGTLAEMLGCQNEARLLGEMGNIYGLLVGAVSVCSVAFCVAFAIFLKCTVAVG